MLIKISGSRLDSKESAFNVGDLCLFAGLGRTLEEGMATHSNILAWRISLTKETDGLQSIGSQTVRHQLKGLSMYTLQDI